MYIEELRSVFSISFSDSNGDIVGSGTGFFAGGHLITNNHVFAAHGFKKATISNAEAAQELTRAEFQNLLISGSDEHNKDFAILKKPRDLSHLGDLTIDGSIQLSLGDELHYFGYPFASRYVSFHKGFVSSLQPSRGIDFIRIDGSVNHGNSGGPLIHSSTNKVVGIVTRKETGLTKMVESLEAAGRRNVDLLNGAGSRVIASGVDLLAAASALQIQLLETFKEIKRSSNVGIGMAVAIRYIEEELKNIN